LTLEALEIRVTPTTSTWSGAVSNLWSDAGNWDVPPAAGSDLVFPEGAANLSNTNDLTSSSQFGSLTIQASGYTLAGNAVALTGSIDASQDSGASTVSLPISVGGTTTVTVDNSGASLEANGVISGSGGVTKQGDGTLILSGSNAYNGETTIVGGALQVNGTQPASAVTVQSGATLAGIGSVGPITSNSGTIAPGDSGPGILTDTGSLTMGTGSSLDVALNGTTAGTDYSQLKVAGQVNISDATLNAVLGFSPTANEQLVILNNTGSQPIQGTFHGLSEGSDLTLSGQEFQISYHGGDGNDVVLTHLLSSSTAVTSSPDSPVFGQAVTLTATVTGTETQTPAGTVEFFNGSTSLGNATLVNGVATLQLSNLAVGDNSITANYKGDINFSPNTSPAATVTIGQAATTSTLTATPNPSPFGQSVTLTATIAAVGPGVGTPTGTVEFFTGTTSLGTATLSDGKATLQTTEIPAGTNTLTVHYQGDTNFQASTSPGLAQTVSPTAPTTTALTTSASSITFGESITLTATIAKGDSTSGSPTGSVQFFSGTTSLGTATLTDGVATLSTTSLPAGSDSVTARYLGDSTFAPSTSSVSTVTVSPSATTSTLTATPNPSPFGQSVTLTVTIAAVSPGAGNPTGTVEFFNGATSLGTATISDGKATLTSTTIPAGTASLTAHYEGDANFQASVSPAVSQTITPTASTTTNLSTSESSIVVGQQITLTATVAPSSQDSNSLTGTVEFFSGTTSLGTATLTDGTATLQSTALPLGSDAITARYEGDSNFAPSTSSASTVTVAQAATTSAVTASPNPSALGNSVTLTATITVTSPGSGTPTGTVEFFNGSTSLGQATIDSHGVATMTTLSLPLGANSLTAVYSGDANFTASTAPAFTQTVLTPTTTTVDTSSSSLVFGQSVTLTAHVSTSGSPSSAPTGTVQFFSGSTLLGSGTITAGVATLDTTKLPTGTNLVTAVYQGDATFATSTSTQITVSVTQASSSIALSVSPTSASLGQTVTLKATVTAVSPGAGLPTGTVTFSNGTTSLGSATIDADGVATLTTTALPLGTATITAAYAGDTNFASSSSSATTLNVSTANSTTTLSSFQSPSFVGQQIILTATIRSSNNPTNPTIPTGSVQFFNGSTLLGTVALGVNAQASFLVPGILTAGTTSFTAVYSGDTNYVTSTSSPFVQQVVPGASVTSVGAAGTAVPNQPITLTAFVGPRNPANGQPTGSVTFLVNGQAVGTSALANGQATLTVNSLPVGNTSIQAVYSGDANYQGSTSVSTLITVGNSTQLFVNQVFEQYLHRPPTNAALNVWTHRLERGFPTQRFVQTVRRQALTQNRRLRG